MKSNKQIYFIIAPFDAFEISYMIKGAFAPFSKIFSNVFKTLLKLLLTFVSFV